MSSFPLISVFVFARFLLSLNQAPYDTDSFFRIHRVWVLKSPGTKYVESLRHFLHFLSRVCKRVAAGFSDDTRSNGVGHFELMCAVQFALSLFPSSPRISDFIRSISGVTFR